MSRYSLSHVPDSILLRDLKALVSKERATTAELIAHIAEVDARKLYLPAAHPSMFSYCVGELGLSEDAAWKRIQVARCARRFPVIFEALADGRLHLCGAVLLTPHLSPQNARDLVGAAAGKRKSEIERIIAERFPRTELLPMVQPLRAMSPTRDGQPAPGQVDSRYGQSQPSFDSVGRCDGPQHAPEGSRPPSERGESPCAQPQLAPERVGSTDAQMAVASARPALEPHSRVAPVGRQRYAVQFMMGQESQDDLDRIQELIGQSAGIDEIFARSLQLLRQHLERRKLAATDRPRRAAPRAGANPRYVPRHVRRKVWLRDGGQCTYVGDSGKRCPGRHGVELDHVIPVAQGGLATIDNLRLRCRAHNQHAAECQFGAEFMRQKREAAREAASRRRGERRVSSGPPGRAAGIAP